MEFTDFKPEELLGKRVLHEYGSTYASKNSRSITTICKVMKTGFRINSKAHSNYLFNFEGKCRGLSVGAFSKCKLITDDQARELGEEFKRNREIREMTHRIRNEIEKENLTHEQLSEIIKIIK